MPEEPKEEQKQEDKDWDKERQRADQEHANFEKAEQARIKAVAENEAIAEEYQALQAKTEELNKQIAAQKKPEDYPELDPDAVDGNVIKTVQQLRTELKTAKEKLAGLETKAANYEKTEAGKAADTHKEKVINKVCTPLDEEYGAEYRNPARKLAEKLVKEGKEDAPQDSYDAHELMEKCYRQLSEKRKKDIPTDDGGGGGPIPPDSRKTGTTEEVLADMKKDKSWKEDSGTDVFI